MQLERQLDVGGDRAPRQQPGLLEGDAVVLVEAGLPGGLAEDRDACPTVAVSRSATSRSRVLLPQPLGPISETNSPAATLEVDVAQRDDLVSRPLAVAEDRGSTPAAADRAARSAVSVSSAGLRQSERAEGEAEQADGAGGDQADRDGAEDRRPGLAGSPTGGLGVLDDHPADAAAQADRHLGDDRADHGAGRGQPERGQQERHAGRQPQA